MKPVFRQAMPKYIAHSNGKTASTFPGRLVAVPRSLSPCGNFAPISLANNSNQTTTLVTANRHPISASISLTRAGPPPLIPARAISGTPHPKAVQIRPKLVESKVVAAAPNVCVTEKGTFVATQVNKTSVISSGATVMNHVVGQSPDANAMMTKMFSVVKGENGIPVTMTPASVLASISRAQAIQQVAHVQPSAKNENFKQNTNVPNQNTGKPNQNTNNAYQNVKVPNQNTHTSYQGANKCDSKTNSTVTYDKNANIGSQNTAQRFSLNVGGGMGAVTTAVRSGMLAREKYQPPDASRDTKHVITHGGGYSVKINENNLETKSGMRSTITNTNIATPNVPDRTPNQSVITPNTVEVTPTVAAVSPTLSEEIPLMADVAGNEKDVENETKDDLDNVPISKRGSTWMCRRRKKKKVRFTYVKGKKNKKKEETQLYYDENGGFEQEFDDGGDVGQRRVRALKRDLGDDSELLFYFCG
jgi:hypothetical protein